MASLDSTESAKVALAAGESLIVTTTGQCTVQGLSGAPSSTTTLTASSQTFGPYGVSAVLKISNVSGRTDYVADNATFPLSRTEKAAFNSLVSKAGNLLTSAVGGSSYGIDILGSDFASSGSATATVSIATPGVVTLNNHGFSAGQPIVFTTTGALPTGLTAGTTYYVSATGVTTNTFQVSATVGGGSIATSGTQSGTHTVTAYSGFLDRTDSGNHMRPCSLNTGAYANAGYMSSIAGAGGFVQLPTQKFAHDMASDSFLFAVTLNMATPGAVAAICGIGNGLTTRPGWYLAARTDGVVVPTFSTASGGFTNAASWAPLLGVAANGSDHTIVMAYDAPTRSVLYWLDGVFKVLWNNVVPVPATGTAMTNTSLSLGSQQAANTSQVAVAAKWKNLKYRIFPGQGLPLNIGAIAKEVTLNPTATRYLDMIAAAATKYIALGWGPAQSNEYGTSDSPDTSSLIGAPCRDVVGTDGTTSFTAAGIYGGSMHPSIQGKAGKRGRWLQTYNTAVGGSSSAHYWCGMFMSWAASKTFGRGAYVIAAGNVYKMTASSGTSGVFGVSGGSAPTWPGSGTVTDNELTWTYLRAATAADVVGTVLDKDHPLFDPNGAFANLKAKLDSAPPAAERWMAVSIGQTDASIGLAQAAYTSALVNAARWGVAQGYKVVVGLTCSAVPAGTVATWLASTGKAGWQAAVAQLPAGAYAGPDAYTAMGDLSVTTDGIGLQADGNNVHTNSFARDVWAALWDASLAAAGA